MNFKVAILEEIDINNVVNDVNYVDLLDTPYYAYKMQQEGIYEDYVNYRDELLEYKKSIKQDEVSMLPILQEPQIPDSIKVFAEKYNII